MLTNAVEPTLSASPLNGDGYVEVTNDGSFTATLYVEYLYNGKYYPINSGLFATGTSKQIILPQGATNIFVLVQIANGLAQFTPVYNYNFDNSRILKLKISGTTFNQSCNDITNDPNYPSTTPPQFYVSIKNSGGFIARFRIKYTFNSKEYKLDSEVFTLEMTRRVILPPKSTNIFVLVEIFNGLKWFPLYNNNFATPKTLQMQLYGTIFSPQYKILPNTPSVGDSPAPKMLVVQYPDKSEVYSGEVVVVVTNVSNLGTATASKVSLLSTLPANATFIPGSLNINNTSTSDIEFPTTGIPLGDIGINNTVIVTYQLTFKATASTNTLKSPIVNYISSDNNNSNSPIVTFTGIATPLTVKVNSNNSGCCNCCCCCTPKFNTCS
ncbi:hypothetical protein [Clostridium botulinum]|uniref:DUF11 domain-containing protein n=1 Tax=Clostridium botulinum TaxID=1491 RepID=A0A9Q1UWB6_CLOBO|nr:hypothetical protein [Clostridium botulinum]AEB76677.1 hypothetical protein CbC4_2008 [Clostridium botulinum BKT015925]KEI00910.1 hypothetical protein Y848_10305 [Clostridium botulinum C/D str. Sp77]KEI04804.1 hypothetical protein Z953_03445 [Clostridium botulinum D str. 16868]KLU76851.1 hypothetical protein CBC3_01540 [Clostridium botulinum V891]KOA74208.1 hypothetical protein ADU78_10970 [Clostridium botulinum]